MAERKYSVTEIDQMRFAMVRMYLGPDNPTLIEERLRTYMLNGTEPDELEEAADAFTQKRLATIPGYRRDPGAVSGFRQNPMYSWDKY